MRRNGVRVSMSNGYTMVAQPGHPRADLRHGLVYEHVLIASEAIGRALPLSAEVHHVNGNRADNGRTNLVVCENHAYHCLLHVRQRAFDACGDPNAKRCSLCSRYDRQHDITTTTFGCSYHRDCKAASERGRRERLTGRVIRDQRSECRNGHERTAENTVIDCRGRRSCVVCRKATLDRYVAKKHPGGAA